MLGRFGSSAPALRRIPGGTGVGPVGGAIALAREELDPSAEHNPAASGQLMPGLRNLSHSIVFSSSDSNTVAWAAGTIMLSDATSYSIDAGNTGNISALTFIYLDVATSSTVLQTSTTYSDATGDQKHLLAIAENVADATKYAKFYVFGGTGGFGGTWITSANFIANLIITADLIANATITSGKTVVGLHSLSHNLVFSASDNDTVAWASGTITGSDGTNYTITGSNTGNMTLLTYIYLDTGVSTTALQTTTTYSSAVGDTRILIAVAKKATDTNTNAYFQVFNGIGGISVNADQINNLSITAALISNLTIVAGKIASSAVETDKINTNAVTVRYLDTAGNTNLTGTPTYDDIISRTFTPAVVEDVLIIAGFTIEEKTSATAGEMTADIQMDAATIAGSSKAEYLPLIGVNNHPTSMTLVVVQTSVSAASHTFKLRIQAPSANWTATNNTMAILELKR